MAKSTLPRGVDTGRLPWTSRYGYASGDLAFNLYWQSIGYFLYFFYTDILGISPFWAGIAYAVATAWDAISDPIMGAIADRTKTRWGRFRPYLLIGAIPCAVFFVASFWAPPLEGFWLVVYACLTHIGLRTFYTVANIPFIAMSGALTTDSRERTRLAGARMSFAALGGISVSFGFPAIVEWVGGEPRTAWLCGALVMSVVATLILFSCFAMTREALQVKDGQKPLAAASMAFRNVGSDLPYFWRMLRTNRPLAQVFGSVIVIAISITMFQKCQMYWFKYAVGDQSLAKYALLLGSVMLLIGSFVWPIVASRTSKRTTWFIGCGIAAIGYAGFFFYPASWIGVGMILVAFITFGKAATSVMFWAMIPDTVEYGEWKSGMRDDAKAFGYVVFGQKAALALNAVILGQWLSWIEFVPNQAQSNATLFGLRIVMTILPLLGIVASVLIIWRYPLNAERHGEIVAELKTRSAVNEEPKIRA